MLIHAIDLSRDGEGPVARVLHRWRAWATTGARKGPAARVALQIADMQGRPLFHADELPPLIEVPLPAGTYHVTVNLGEQQRRYTVALKQGTRFDLYLRGAWVAR